MGQDRSKANTSILWGENTVNNLLKILTWVDNKLNDMRVEIASIKGNQEGFSKRLDNLEFTSRGIFIIN
ncbi:hypothetical protein CSQ80_00260 [Cyanobacterium aponinum IPPAS B-1201]|nr:hypothetical protein CSQ80_00260 [Cyanobacterium aponinum IPPAS B-1201]